MRRRLWLISLLLLVAAGCAVPSARSRPGSAAREITIAFVGDILLTDEALAGQGPDYPWALISRQLRQADLAIGNLESAVSTRGAPVPEKQFTFRASPRALAGAARAGIDVLSLANNHTGDYGPEALLDTIRHVRAAGIHPVGAGRDLDSATRPVIFDVDGRSIAILAFTRVVPEPGWLAAERHPGLAPGWDPAPVLAAIRAARARADAVIVLMHWGEEMADHPLPADRQLAEAMIGAGAAVVAGHHPHVLQGVRRFGGHGLIAYSLGNFIFTSSASPLGRLSAILTVTLGERGVTRAHLTPLVIEAGQPRPAPRDEAQAIVDRLRLLSHPTDITPQGAVTQTAPD